MTQHTPVSLPAVRHDGWTPVRIAQFLDHLATGGSVSVACARVGMSREAAYRLRRRDALFARGWNAALVLAREAAAEVLEQRAIDGVEEQIWFRGELVGTRRKFDSRLLLAHMARLDSLAQSERAGEDAARFDELLALASGGTAPDATVMADDDDLPLTRDMALYAARTAAAEEWDESPPQERTDADPQLAGDRAEAEAAVHWDAWLERAHRAADRLLATPPEAPGTLSTLSTSPADGTPVALSGYPAWKARNAAAIEGRGGERPGALEITA